MADNDKFMISIGSCWKPFYKAVHGCADAWDAAALAPGCVSRLLRESGGVPDFAEYVQILEPFFGAQQTLFENDGAGADAACAELARARAGQGMISTLAERAARVAQGIALEAHVAGRFEGEAGLEFAHRLLIDLTHSLCLERLDGAPKVAQRFVAENGGDAQAGAEAQLDFCDQISGHLPMMMESLAPKLASDPSGQKLPRRVPAQPKPGTAKLLDLVVSL